jgi:RimJ/RimL family protein N-acetyltransferase
MSHALFETDRLVLRPWRPTDREPFALMNADPRVMRYFPATLSREESDGFFDLIGRRFLDYGYGLWAVDRKDTGEWIGFVGLVYRPRSDFAAPFAPCHEVGWRLRAEHWGQGFAPEAAQVALRFGFAILRLEEIVSFTVPANQPSRRVMEKIGLGWDPEGDFEHPNLPEWDPLRRHVLYRLSRHSWLARQVEPPEATGT